MIRVKDDSVQIWDLTPACQFGLMVADQVLTKHGYETVITSGHESATKHMDGSLHYSGNAVDLRKKHIPDNLHEKIRSEIEHRLGKDFDVIVGSRNFHLECQPRRRALE